MFKTVCQDEQKQAVTNQQQSLRRDCSQISGMRSEKNRVRFFFAPSRRQQMLEDGVPCGRVGSK